MLSFAPELSPLTPSGRQEPKELSNEPLAGEGGTLPFLKSTLIPISSSLRVSVLGLNEDGRPHISSQEEKH